jgi:hypothetical protein
VCSPGSGSSASRPGFLHFGGESSWNELLGGTLKFNDKRGATAIAVRGGYTTELRLIRTLVF